MNWADVLGGSGGLLGPTIWVDPVPTKQLPQPLDLAVQLVVFLDDRGQVHPGGPFPLQLGQPGQELLFLVAQGGGLLEVISVDRGLLLPPHLGQLLLSLAKIIGHGHADQPHPRTYLLAAGIAALHLDDLLTDAGEVGAIIRATAGLRADPAELLANQAPGLRIVPGTAAPGDAA